MSFDLNLLRILSALNEHRNVSRAAEQLGMSQSGFSTALGRLRTELGDPLFVRTARGMQPTPRASAAIATASRMLAAVEQDILGLSPFQPSELKTEFCIAVADVGVQAFVPRLMHRIWQTAPGVSIKTPMLPPGDLERALERGEIDLAIGYYPDLNKGSLHRQRLFTHTFGALVNAARPVRDGVLSLDEFCSIGHAVTDMPLRSHAVYESFLARHKITRRVVITTPHHLSLPYLVAELDVLAMVPVSLAMACRNTRGVQVVRPPFTPPTFVVGQHWHERYHLDPRNQWLRQHFVDLFRDDDVWLSFARDLYGALPPPVDR